jgi:hypothetical protein
VVVVSSGHRLQLGRAQAFHEFQELWVLPAKLRAQLDLVV